MAQEHLNHLMTEAGIDQAEIDAILGLPVLATDAKPEDVEKAKTALDAFTGKLNSSFETRIKNDSKFWEGLDENNVNEALKKKIENQQYGRAVNIVRQKALKAFGLKEEDMNDLSDDDKKQLETYITKAGEKFAATKVSDKQLQADLVETRKKLEAFELEIPEKEGKIKSELETRFNSEKLDFIILAELAAIPGLKAPAQYLVGKLAAELRAENAFVIDGLKANPMQKDKPTLKVLDGSKEVSLKDLIVKKLKADDLIGEAKAEGGKQSGKTTVEIENEEGKLGISSHIADKIKANMPAS